MLLSIFTIPVTLLIVEGALGSELNLGIGAVTKKIMVMYLIPVVAGMLLHRLSLPAATTVARIAAPVAKVASLLLLLMILAIRFPAPTFVLAKLNGILDPIVPVILAYLIFGSVLLALYHKLLEKPEAGRRVPEKRHRARRTRCPKKLETRVHPSPAKRCDVAHASPFRAYATDSEKSGGSYKFAPHLLTRCKR